MDIECGAGGDELLDHQRVARHRGRDERSESAEKAAAGLSSVRQTQTPLGPYPSFCWTSRAAPAAMSCSTTSVWPVIAAKMSAVSLPRSQLQGRMRAADADATSALPFVVLDIECGAGGDELLDHQRVALRRGRDERSEPAKKLVAGLNKNSVRQMQTPHGPYPLLFWISSPAPAAMSCSTTCVWPFTAAKMSAVSLPRSQLQG